MYRILALLLFLSSCSLKDNSATSNIDTVKVIIIQDYRTDRLVDSLKLALAKANLKAVNEKLRADSLSLRLFIADYKIEKVNFYLKLCLQDDTQTKYLKGWLRRALE